MDNTMNPITGNNREWEAKQQAKIIRDTKMEEYKNKIGKTVYIKMQSLQIPVIVKDAKQSFGHFRLLVSPVAGRGEIWIQDFIE